VYCFATAKIASAKPCQVFTPCVGAEKGFDEVVGGSLGGRIRTRRVIGALLGEVSFRTKASIDLTSGYVQEENRQLYHLGRTGALLLDQAQDLLG
jgi:hypothetical protein